MIRFRSLFIGGWVGLLLVAAVPTISMAQTVSSEILGFISDASNAAVPGAKVTITRISTNEVRSTRTSAAGDYSFPAVAIGEYTLTVEMGGFRKASMSHVRVETQEKVRVDLRLEIGEVSQTLEVSAQAVSLKTEDATVGQVIENKRITELPLNGRNLSQLAVMVAGVQFGIGSGTVNVATGQGGYHIPGAFLCVMANGQRELNSSILLDGVDARDLRFSGMSFTPSIEAVEEFKVQTGSYSAEFGQGGGAQVQITMRSGTNRLRGTVFEFLRNDRLDAENYFLNFERPTARLPKDRLRRNQFGAVVGGPVYIPGLYNGRNRTFWLFDYEGRREVAESVLQKWYPNQDFRNGNFSALLTPATNPATGKAYRNPIVIYDPLTGDPFPGNLVPTSRLHRGALGLVNQYVPQPQFQQPDILDITNSFAAPQIIAQNQYFGRLDHTFRDSDRVFARVAMDRSRREDGSVNPLFPLFYRSSPTNLASQWLHMFSPTTLNEFRFGLNIADAWYFNPRTNTTFDPDTLGIGKFRVFTDNNRKFKPFESGIPVMGLFDIGDRNSPGIDSNSSYQLANHMTFVRNRHTFKAGFEYRYITVRFAQANIPRGSLAFSSLDTGLDFASFLLGYPNSASTGEGVPLTLPRNPRQGAYLLDEWKITPRLSVNLGLRWDYYGVPVDRGGYWRTLRLDQTENVPGVGPVPKIIPPGTPSSAGAIPLWEYGFGTLQPRMGLALRPANKWVVRTGAGYFANMQRTQTFTLLNLMPPLSGSDTFTSVTDVARTVSVGGVNVQTRKFRAGVPMLTLDEPFPSSLLGRATRTNLDLIPQDYKQSSHAQWSLDIQRELPFSTALTVGYVGSKTSHLGNNYNNLNSPRPSSDTNVNARRPYQKYFDDGVKDLGTVRYWDSNANGFYHGLQLTVEKRYSKGLSYGLAYTYSKAHGEGPGGGNEYIVSQNFNDRRSSRGRFDFDLRQNVVFHYVWEIPFLRKLKGPAGQIFSGWQTNGILSLRTGFPLTITQGADLNTGGTVLPDRVADGRLDERSRVLWYDPTAFRRVTCNVPSRPDLCRYGNAGVNILESPGQKNLDFSLFKNFVLNERYRVQFRSEFFNATNTPYFGQPNGISFVGNDTLVPNGPRMGEIRSLRGPMRVIQFGLKLFF